MKVCRQTFSNFYSSYSLCPILNDVCVNVKKTGTHFQNYALKIFGKFFKTFHQQWSCLGQQSSLVFIHCYAVTKILQYIYCIMLCVLWTVYLQMLRCATLQSKGNVILIFCVKDSSSFQGELYQFVSTSASIVSGRLVVQSA